MKIDSSKMYVTDISTRYGYDNVFDFITNIHNIRDIIDDNDCLKNIENDEYYVFNFYRSFISNFRDLYSYMFDIFLFYKYSLFVIIDKNNKVHIYKIKDKNIEYKLTIKAIEETDVSRFLILEYIENNDDTFTIYSTFDFTKCIYRNDEFLGKVKTIDKVYNNVYRIVFSDCTTGVYKLDSDMETLVESKNNDNLYTYYTNKYSTNTEYFTVISKNNKVEIYNITDKPKLIFKTKGEANNYGGYYSKKVIDIKNKGKYTFYDLEDKHLILENSDFINCDKKRLNAEDYYIFNDKNYKYYIYKQDKMQLILDEIDELDILDEISNVMIITKNEESDLLHNFKSVEIKKTPTLLMHYYNEFM